MMLMKKLKIIVFGLLVLLAPNSYAQKNAPTGLLCNLLAHPECSAITHRIPDFGWVVNPGVKADYQTAYEIQVATSSELLQEGHPDLWSSGKIQSRQSINIKYDGRRLEPHRSYWWRVRTWGRTGRPAPWSARQQFNTSSFDAVRAWPGESKWLAVSDAQGEEFWTFENRHPIRYHDVTPVRVGPPVNGGQLYDFGRAAFAYLTFNLTWEPAAAQAQNNSLRLSIGEKAAGDSIDPKPGGCIVYQEYQLQLKPGTHDYRLEIPVSFLNTPTARQCHSKCQRSSLSDIAKSS
jgi:alpha-L-rhamnosidase